MKKTFNVKLYYHGCYETEVQAENEELAVLEARRKASCENADDFITETGLTDEDHDVEEVKPLTLAERWWGQTPFRTMEQVTGLREEDFPGDDDSQAFVDACDAWWNSQTDEEKIDIWKANKDRD